MPVIEANADNTAGPQSALFQCSLVDLPERQPTLTKDTLHRWGWKDVRRRNTDHAASPGPGVVGHAVQDHAGARWPPAAWWPFPASLLDPPPKLVYQLSAVLTTITKSPVGLRIPSGSPAAAGGRPVRGPGPPSTGRGGPA